MENAAVLIMGIFSRLRRWLTAAFMDPEEEQPGVAPEEEMASSIPARAVRPLECLICTPLEFKDARQAVNALAKGQIVVVRLTEVDDGLGQRILDFVSGAVYLLHGSMQFIGSDVAICTPDSVRVEQGDYQFNVVAMPVFRRVGS